MRTFIIVSFVLAVIGWFFKALRVMFSTYPRHETFSLGEDLLSVIESVVWALIAGFLLWR